MGCVINECNLFPRLRNSNSSYANYNLIVIFWSCLTRIRVFETWIQDTLVIYASQLFKIENRNIIKSIFYNSLNNNKLRKLCNFLKLTTPTLFNFNPQFMRLTIFCYIWFLKIYSKLHPVIFSEKSWPSCWRVSIN